MWSPSTPRRRRRSRSRSSTPWIATFMYEGDTALAERRAATLALDHDLLRELLGTEELRELLDADALSELELELQRLAPSMSERIRTGRTTSSISSATSVTSTRPSSLHSNSSPEVLPAVAKLRDTRRVIDITVAGERRLVAAEDAGRSTATYRHSATTSGCPPRSPRSRCRSARGFSWPGTRAYDRGPFTTPATSAARFGLGRRAGGLGDPLQVLVDSDRVVRGEFRPDGTEREWCDAGVLRRLRRRSLSPASATRSSGRAGRGRRVPARLARPRPPRPEPLLDALAPLQAPPCRPPGGDRCAATPRCSTTGRPGSTSSSRAARSCGSGRRRVALAFREDAALLARPAPPTARGPGTRPNRSILGQGAEFWPNCSPRPSKTPSRRCPRSGISCGRAR